MQTLFNKCCLITTTNTFSISINLPLHHHCGVYMLVIDAEGEQQYYNKETSNEAKSPKTAPTMQPILQQWAEHNVAPLLSTSYEKHSHK